MEFSNPLGKAPLALVVAFVAAAAFAPAAGATVTNTSITSSTIKAWDMADNTDDRNLPINERTVSGTVDAAATPGDGIVVRCYDPITGSSLRDFGSATVTAAKKWSLTESIYDIRDRRCRIVAVPDGYNEAITAPDLANKYKGSKVVSIGYWERSYQGLGGSAGNVFTYDYEFDQVSQTMGYWYSYSIGSCGLCTSRLRNPVDSGNGSKLWGWNSSNYDGYSEFPTAPASGSNADPLMLVDGKLAMDVYMAQGMTNASQSAYRYGPSGGITASYSINQANGDVTINESQPLYRCLDQADPIDWKRCGSVAQTGVRLNRVITATADHAIWRSADTYVSADGKAHNVRATYVNYEYGNLGYRFGSTGTYLASTKGDKSGNALGVVAKNAYSVLGVKFDRDNATIDYNNPVGDIVMSPRPQVIRVINPSDKYVYARWSLPIAKKSIVKKGKVKKVTGGTSVTVKQAYTIALSDASLTRLRGLAIAGLAK
ncbi:MAG: hypothetical protein NT122_01725 [Solirubrobacterales bacterium]|nr:hypothetical protein [Solirubrobacterales bacterium]